MSKKLIALVVCAVMLLSLATACGSNNNANTNQPNSSNSEPNNSQNETPTDPNAGNEDYKIFYTYLSTDVDTLNGMGTVQEANATPLSWCNSYLWRAVPNDDGMGYHYIPDLAADMPKQIDELTWEFTIRDGAKWHNGDPITADTFMFTFKAVLDPKMSNPMAIFLADDSVTIKNAYDYMLQGTEGHPATMDWEEVGIKQIDDMTIQITTATPVNEKDVCTHFTLRSNLPVHPDTFTAGLTDGGARTLYGTDLDHWMGCGPYFFDSWTRDSVQVYKKNPDHVGRLAESHYRHVGRR